MDMVKPETAGLSSSRLERINRAMQAHVDQEKLPGALTMIARRGQIAHAECFGSMKIEANKPMQQDAIFRIASMTKPITCAALLSLYEEGYFQLTDPISAYIPEFKDVKVFVRDTGAGLELADPEHEITIKHLFMHTSGLCYEYTAEPALASLHEEAAMRTPGLTLQEIVHKIIAIPLSHQPGREWRYGYSHDVLAYLAEVITGKPFDVFLRQRLFEPLGMEDTGFYVPEEKADRLTVLYRRTENGSFEPMTAETDTHVHSPQKPPRGSGALLSTAGDYVRFAQMMLNGGALDGQRVLGRKTVGFMTANHLPRELFPVQVPPEIVLHGYGFGLGVAVLVDVVRSGVLGSGGEYGWPGAGSTSFWVDAREELIGLLMAQLSPPFFWPHLIPPEFKVLTYQAIID